METGLEHQSGTELGRAVIHENGSDDSLYISLSQAAKLWGKSKNTLSVDIAKGKLQWVQHHGKRALMKGQLSGIYGPLSNGTSIEQSRGAEIERPLNEERTAEINGLRAVLQAKEEQISILKQQIERERIHAERWHSAYEQVKALPAPAKIEEPRKQGIWARLFGARS
jgi:hypothetical protein